MFLNESLFYQMVHVKYESDCKTQFLVCNYLVKFIVSNKILLLAALNTQNEKLLDGIEYTS